jgi:hypothetical protein
MNIFAQRHFRSLIFTIWLATSLLLYFTARDFIAQWKMGDPDDQLRLVQVRDWVAGQSWWDITQYRMNPPDGGPMHWSRLVDVPIAAAIIALRPFVGAANAEYAAAILIPLFTYGALLSLFAAIARRLFDARVALVAAVLLILIVPVRAQLQPLRIDHHGWQMVLFLLATFGLFGTKRPLASAALVGAALALWIEISVEGLPFAALMLGLLGLQWLLASQADRQRFWRFPVALSALALTSFAAYSLTEGWRSLPTYCDSLSRFHVAVFAAMAAVVVAGSFALHKANASHNRIAKMVLGATALVAGVAAWWWQAPQCLGDAFATLDPLVRQYWYVRVYEGLPLWKAPVEDALPPLFMLVIGTALLGAWLVHGRMNYSGHKWLFALLYLGSMLGGAMVIRTTAYALLLGAMLLAWGVVGLFQKAEVQKGLGGRMGLRVAAVMLAMTPLFAQSLTSRMTATAQAASPEKAAAEQRFDTDVRACQNYKAAAGLNALPQSRLMAALDSSPSILQFTRHSIVATGHHRNDAAMADVIRTFISDSSTAERIIRTRRIDYIVTCTGNYELRLYADEAPSGLAAMLRKGQPPAWLVQQADIGPYQIWRVSEAEQ